MNSEEQKRTNEEPPPSDGGASVIPGASSAEAAGGVSASRRKMLIRGLVGGPVTLAAMRPVKSFASKKKKYCSYSGWASFKVNPNTSASPKQKCTTGKKAGHYHSGGWPSSIANCFGQTVTLHQSGGSATEFRQLFGGFDTTTCESYLAGSSTQSTFICAVFNAKLVSGYPFTVAQVYAIWSNPTLLGSGVTQSLAALFFKQLDVA